MSRVLVRKWVRWPLLGCLVLTVSACGAGRTAAPVKPITADTLGVVTGIATPCHPQAYGNPASVPVTVTITAYGKTIATQTVTGSHTYRFVVLPGQYVVSSNGVGSTPPATVGVKAGEVVRANLLSDCI